MQIHVLAQNSGSTMWVTIICLLIFFEEFLRDLGPSFRCWNSCTAYNKQTNFVKTILHTIHLASGGGGPTNAPPRLLLMPRFHIASWSLVCFPFSIVGRWGTTTTIYYDTSSPHVKTECVYMSWCLLVSSTLVWTWRKD
jgi:hypothetical protein